MLHKHGRTKAIKQRGEALTVLMYMIGLLTRGDIYPHPIKRSVAKVDGIPLIVAHEICSRWGDGCKTKEDGYCFLFEPQESEEE